MTAYGSKTEDGQDACTPGEFVCQKSSPCRDIHLEDIVHHDVKTPFVCSEAYGDAKGVSPQRSCLLE